MSDTAISIENLGKRYRIGAAQNGRARYKSLRDSISKTLLTPSRILRLNRSGRGRSAEDTSFWALKGLSFEIKRGEIVGLIGRNGAGKSTLLKILSRITEPTTGRVYIQGRVASLLEVGTGFHPELSGRENIFMNGSILGMSRFDIARKFDEIVAFAEVARFLDTPVKHYSSGMYVRLAFAVAAHIEPHILIVDEVLAVGDSNFQRKCIGKIQEVGKNGRTVLFVSHNMAAVKSLTRRGIVLCSGEVRYDGPTNEALQRYASEINEDIGEAEYISSRGVYASIRRVRLVNEVGQTTRTYTPGDDILVQVDFATSGARGLSFEIFLKDSSQANIGMASAYQFQGVTLPEAAGAYICILKLAPMWLSSGTYYLEARTSVVNVTWDHCIDTAFRFEVLFTNPLGFEYDFKQSYGHGPLALLSTEPLLFSKYSQEMSDRSD